jgi:hypothetical protein
VYLVLLLCLARDDMKLQFCAQNSKASTDARGSADILFVMMIVVSALDRTAVSRIGASRRRLLSSICARSSQLPDDSADDSSTMLDVITR